ncbi:hypothetical protein ACNQO9_00300 [Acinetobacter calcoaceticus]|jgi:hypothetical protein
MLDILNEIWRKPEAFAQVLAASIGVIGLAITFLITFFRTKSFQKSEKIAEARLTIYLDLVEKYSIFILFINMNKRDLCSNKLESLIQENLLNLVVSYNKACIVCSSETKKEFDVGFKKIFKLHEEIMQYGIPEGEIQNKILQIEKLAVEMSLHMRKELDVLKDINLEIQIIKDNYSAEVN